MKLDTGHFSTKQVTTKNCPRYKRYYINKEETLIVFDETVDLIQTQKVKYLSNKFLKTFSFLSYLAFQINCYDEINDDLYYMKLILVTL